MAPVDRRICGGSLSSGGEGGTAEVIMDPPWHIREYVEEWVGGKVEEERGKGGDA